MDDFENHVKVSDSAYSNSCSNSRSRKSHSSKWTNSGSNSSRSSGYGGKLCSYGSKSKSPTLLEKRKEKDSKKKKFLKNETSAPQTQKNSDNRTLEEMTNNTSSNEDKTNVGSPPGLTDAHSSSIESMDLVPTEKNITRYENGLDSVLAANHSELNFLATSNSKFHTNGFSCVISMHDGAVIYTTSSLTICMGYPYHMLIGRSFIEFVHPRDRLTFTAQITNGLAIQKNVNCTQKTAPTPQTSVSTMVCRLRQYRALGDSYNVKKMKAGYSPFLLKLSFKNVTDEEGKIIYLVVQATQFVSAFKVPNEPMTDVVPFVIRHDANGNLEYIDPESVPYLGYLPQDICAKDALQIYHPEDLNYLCQVYETIVKEGCLAYSKPFRLLTQNGDYLKVETEWSSFINPWSKKLEFIIGKHHLIEGPKNPDVFEPKTGGKNNKQSVDEISKAHYLREKIIRIMNEMNTNPAEMVRNKIDRRCQYLTTVMDNWTEKQLKGEDKQDPYQSCYERDTVMLGGISPHHDYNDSKSSTEISLIYDKLNYKKNLQRYFDSHLPYDDYNMVTDEFIPNLQEPESGPETIPSPPPLLGDSNGISSLGEASGMGTSNSSVVAAGDYQPIRLTEFLLCKHNTEMEKELVKMHKDNSYVNEADREKTANENKTKKKEHLARCLNSFQFQPESRPHGLKRASNANDADPINHKHHCPSPRANRWPQPTSTVPALPSSTVTSTDESSVSRDTHRRLCVREPQAKSSVSPDECRGDDDDVSRRAEMPCGTAAESAEVHCATAPLNSINMIIIGADIPQQMSEVKPMSPTPGVLPVHFGNPMNQVMWSANVNQPQAMFDTSQFNHDGGQAVYGSPFMNSAVTSDMACPLQDDLMEQTLKLSNSFNKSRMNSTVTSDMACPLQDDLMEQTLKLSNTFNRSRMNSAVTSDMACPLQDDLMEQTLKLCNTFNKSRKYKKKVNNSWRDKKRSEIMEENADSSNSSNVLTNQSSIMGTNSLSTNSKFKTQGNSEDRTDEESSYSSFYSSFFKTESGSAEESDRKQDQNMNTSEKISYRDSQKYQVSVSSELVYKYQVSTKTLDEVLLADKESLSKLEQPSLVNEQLSQLYFELQLDGVAEKLTLEEGFTSSSSSGEETFNKPKRVQRRKHAYSKLALIYEEETPLPPPSTEGNTLTVPSNLTS